MRFLGERGELRRSIRVAAEARWQEWCREVSGRPYLRAFAERWVELMEARIGPRAQVRSIAEETMLEAERDVDHAITGAETREVILALYGSWDFGSSLRMWAKRNGILRQND